MKREWKILVVDSDPNVGRLLQDILEPQGYRVEVATSGQQALEMVETFQPHLVILEVELPDVEGPELCRHIRSQAEPQPLPVVFLTGRRDPADRLKGLRAGAIEYLTKPFQREELLTRLQNILETIYSRESPIFPGALQNGRLNFIHYVLKKGSRILKPEMKKDSPTGYNYPEVQKFLKVSSESEAINFLESLVQEGWLYRRLYDVLLLCPHCGSRDVHYRWVCPSCHFPITEDSPKRQEGTPVSLCPNCGSSFQSPAFFGRCFQCGKDHDQTKARRQPIFAYELNPTYQRFFHECLRSPSLLEKALQEVDLPYFDGPLLERHLAIEIKRAERNHQHLTCLWIEFAGLADMIQKKGERNSLRILRNVLLVLKKFLREFDMIFPQGETDLSILLPDTPLEAGKMIATRIESFMGRLSYPIQVYTTLAAYPEHGSSHLEILDFLEEQRDARRMAIGP